MAFIRRSILYSLLTLALSAAVGLGAAQSAFAVRSITTTGLHHTCAQSLTNILASGGTVQLHEGHPFTVYEFGSNGIDPYAYVFGWNNGGRYGYVNNGWFC